MTKEELTKRIEAYQNKRDWLVADFNNPLFESQREAMAQQVHVLTEAIGQMQEELRQKKPSEQELTSGPFTIPEPNEAIKIKRG
jgi:23S rRNA G2069 N7-methylase RlmK/C1962 C5-methylase RlmI